MGVDHGGNAGDKSPPQKKNGVGDTNANYSPQIFVIYVQKERSVAFKICQNPFSAGALAPDPAGGAHDALPDPQSAGEGTPLPIPHRIRHRPTVGARHASPPNSSQIYAYGFEINFSDRKERSTVSSVLVTTVGVGT